MTRQPPVQVEFASRRDWLEATLSGVGGTLDDALGYWRRIGAEVARTGARRVLVIDRTHAKGTLSRHEYERMLELLREDVASTMAAAGTRVAFVLRDARLIPQVEYGVVLGRIDGVQVSLFADAQSAKLWLRYGER
ncbi:MAG: hypothetical protein QM761_09660 [Pseudoxanthomonas sp.]